MQPCRWPSRWAAVPAASAAGLGGISVADWAAALAAASVAGLAGESGVWREFRWIWWRVWGISRWVWQRIRRVRREFRWRVWRRAGRRSRRRLPRGLRRLPRRRGHEELWLQRRVWALDSRASLKRQRRN